MEVTLRKKCTIVLEDKEVDLLIDLLSAAAHGMFLVPRRDSYQFALDLIGKIADGAGVDLYQIPRESKDEKTG